MSTTRLTFTVSFDCYSNIAGLWINGYKYGSRKQDEKDGDEVVGGLVGNYFHKCLAEPPVDTVS